MPTKKTSERRPYPSGEIVFAKLKGYPWWPAKIEDESNVPKAVLEAKRKKKTATGAYTVFFFGSLDYAFFSEKMLRPFNHKIVQQDIKTAKIKNKDLVEALYQALDPASLDYLQEPTQQQDRGSNDIYQRQKIKHTKSNNTPSSRSSTKPKNTAAATAAMTTKKNVPKSTKKRSLESKDHSKVHDGNDQPTTTGGSKKRICMAESLTSRLLIHKSKAIEMAARNSPQYEHIYGHRHKLQRLIYDKKPGEVPTSDHSKINDILQDIEQCDMTKELLKYTKIGKVIQFGCSYLFEDDNYYRLQERCVKIMGNWKASLLAQHGSPAALKTTTITLPALPKVTTTTTNNESPSAILNNDSGCEAKNKGSSLATLTSPETGKIISVATESQIKDNDNTTSNISTLENNKHPAVTQKKRDDNDSNTSGTTKIEFAL